MQAVDGGIFSPTPPPKVKNFNIDSSESADVSLNNILKRQLDLIGVNLIDKNLPNNPRLVNKPTEKTAPQQNISKENLTKQLASVNQRPLIKQVNVLNQTADGTCTGAENCGYHSLKNALCLMTALFSENNPINSFRDAKLFADFYQHYASPLLTERAKGKKDASDPILRQMISHFISDQSPPIKLLPLQKILKNNQEKLGIFTLLPTNNEIGLRLGVMDEAGFMDALKLFRFSQNSGPSAFICPVGNVNTGHWYSIAVIKREDGAMEFYGCDSLEANQRGIISPLGKVCSLLEHAMLNPKEFIGSALSSFIEGFERYGDWLDSKGMADTDESKKTLLELAKNPPFLPKACALALENMIEQNWQNSSDIQRLLQFQKVKKLANFYANELPLKRSKLILEIFTKAKKQFNFDTALESTMTNTLAYFDTLLSQPHYKNNVLKTKTTFEFMLKLYLNREVIASENDPCARDNNAHVLTNAGIEKGFITGNAVEAKKSIEYRILLLIIAFQKTKAMGREEEFYTMLAEGDSCANARMGRVEDYLGSLSELGDLQQDLSDDRIFIVTDVALMTVIDEMVYDGKITPEEIEHLTSQDINEIDFAKALASLVKSKSEKTIAFLDYLVRKKICSDKNQIDWTHVSKQLIDSNDFKTILRRGKNLSIPNY